MSSQTLVFHHDVRPLRPDGVDALAEAGKLTPRPDGRNVIVAGPLVAHSGVGAAGSVELSDSREEMGAPSLVGRGPA